MPGAQFDLAGGITALAINPASTIAIVCVLCLSRLGPSPLLRHPMQGRLSEFSNYTLHPCLKVPPAQQCLSVRRPSTAPALRHCPTRFTTPREAISGGIDSGFQPVAANVSVFYPKNHTTTLPTFMGEREREGGEATATATQQSQHRRAQACPHSKHETAVGFF
jgi:hypothetical protein